VDTKVRVGSASAAYSSHRNHAKGITQNFHTISRCLQTFERKDAYFGDPFLYFFSGH